MINVFKVEPDEIGVLVSKEVVEDYKDYYKLIGCDNFDVARMMWDGHEISIYVDDEGMLKTGMLGRDVQGYPSPLFGTLVVTGGVDSKGETLSVPEEIHIMDILKYVGEIKYVVS